MGSSAVDYVGEHRGSIIEVKCTTLDDIVQEYDLDHIDFIKMDIEGAELDVLKGASHFFKIHRPRLIIEPHVVGGELNTNDVIECLNGYNYQCRIIEQWGVSIPLITAKP